MPIGSASEMFNGLKSKLGFSHDEDDVKSRVDEFDEYDDFDKDDYNAADDQDYAGYGSDYESRKPVGGYRPATTRSSRFGKSDSSPDLVTISDVKAHTQLPDSLSRDPLPSDRGSRSTYRSSGRELIDNTGPAESSPAYKAARSARAGQARSEGLDSLFEPTGGSSSYDPYEAYSGTRNATYKSTRGLTVVQPVSYNDVERVSRALKAGDVAVLNMRSTPDDLSKRVLDFSFGVASALDASVECPAPKVFVIARGAGLTSDEKRRLSTQGVL